MDPNESHGGHPTNTLTLGTPVPDDAAPSKPSSKLAPHTKPTTKPTPKTTDPVPGDRQWSDYEMQTVLALICKGYHRKKGGALTFATALNEALNGKRREHMDDDVEVEDVALLLEWLGREKKGALAFIERQSTHVITRTARRVFHKNLPFDGSREEGRDMAQSPGRRATSNDNVPRTSGGRYSHRDSDARQQGGRPDLCGGRPADGQGWSWD